MPCMERARVASDALPTVSKFKILIYTNWYNVILSLKANIIFSNTRNNFYFVTVRFNINIKEFEQSLASSIEGAPSCIMIYKILKVDSITIRQNSIHVYIKLDLYKAKWRECTSIEFWRIVIILLILLILLEYFFGYNMLRLVKPWPSSQTASYGEAV